MRKALAFTLLLGGLTAAGAQVPTSLLALSKEAQTLSIVDPTSMKVLARIPVGGNPHEVIASSDGKRAYVSNYGNGALNTITVVDLVARKPLTTIELGPLYGPHGLTFVGGHPWFTAEREKVINRLDPTTNRVEWQLGTGQIGTHMLWVSQDQKHIVTVNVGSGTVSLIQQRDVVSAAEAAKQGYSKVGAQTTRGANGPPLPEWDEAVVKVGTHPEGFDVLHDASGNPTQVWVANYVEGTVSIVDFAKHAVVATFDPGVKTALRLRFTPDGKRALVATDTGHDLIVIDVATHKVLKRIPIGTGGGGILITPDGARAFVSSSPDNYVSAIDLKTLTVSGKVDVGKNPDGLAWAAPGDPNGGVSP